MITLSELFVYDFGVVFMAAICLIGIICVTWALLSGALTNADGVIKILIGILTLVCLFGLIMCGLSVVYGDITSDTITVCGVSTTGESCNLVADTSEQVYTVCDEEASMKLQVNQTRDVLVYHSFDPFNRGHPEIVKVEGAFCPSGIATSC